MSTGKTAERKSEHQAPSWLHTTVYEPKRQRTVALVKQAVDALVELRRQDGTTRVSLNSIVAMSKQKDPSGKGVAHTAILENEEAYAYYKKHRTASKQTKQSSAQKKARVGVDQVKTDHGLTRVRQRYMKLSREELAEQLLAIEQQYAQLHERYLNVNDKLLEWQLRAEQAENQLEALRKSVVKKNEDY